MTEAELRAKLGELFRRSEESLAAKALGLGLDASEKEQRLPALDRHDAIERFLNGGAYGVDPGFGESKSVTYHFTPIETHVPFPRKPAVANKPKSGVECDEPKQRRIVLDGDV